MDRFATALNLLCMVAQFARTAGEPLPSRLDSLERGLGDAFRLDPSWFNRSQSYTRFPR